MPRLPAQNRHRSHARDQVREGRDGEPHSASPPQRPRKLPKTAAHRGRCASPPPAIATQERNQRGLAPPRATSGAAPFSAEDLCARSREDERGKRDGKRSRNTMTRPNSATKSQCLNSTSRHRRQQHAGIAHRRVDARAPAISTAEQIRRHLCGDHGDTASRRQAQHDQPCAHRHDGAQRVLEQIPYIEKRSHQDRRTA